VRFDAGDRGVPGGPAAPAASRRPASAAAAGAPRHGIALAPRPGRPPPPGRLPTQAPGPAADRAFRPRPGAAPGSGESQLGLPASARRTAGAWGEGGRVHRMGDLEGGRDRPAARAGFQHLGRLPPFPGRRPAGMRLPGNGHPDRSADVRVRGDRAHQPPDPDPGRHRAPDRILGGAGREEPCHGPRGRRLPGAAHDPRPGRQIPRACSTPSSPTWASKSCSAASGCRE